VGGAAAPVALGSVEWARPAGAGNWRIILTLYTSVLLICNFSHNSSFADNHVHAL
jgi:hypothetical protein